MKTTIDIIVRIFTFPFIFVASLIFHLIKWLQWSYYFIIYGGEIINYYPDTRKTIYSIFKKLEEDENNK
jgi:hypothetical protein